MIDQFFFFGNKTQDMSNPGSMFLGAGGQQGLGQGAYQLQADQKPESTDIMKNLSRAAIRRMARKGGCKRVSFKIHEESRIAVLNVGLYFSFLHQKERRSIDVIQVKRCFRFWRRCWPTQ